MARIETERVGKLSFGHIVLGVIALGALLALPQPALAGGAPPEEHSCPIANCTANDLDALVTGIAFASDPTCEGPADTVDVEIQHTLSTSGGGSRYDIGLYTTIDGGANLECLVDILDGDNATGFTNIDPDGCGDVDGDDVAVHTQVYTVPCADNDADGFLDPITIWQSWANNPNQIDGGNSCNRQNVIEGTSAKCRMTVTVADLEVPPVCGDEILGGGEECDDGNTLDGDGCNATCQLEYCGDSVINDTDETCDDGNSVGGDGCSATCQIEACGNNVVDVGEECDDGNTVDGDGCSATCDLEYCGDGILQVGLDETCDDGNEINGDGCDDNCHIEVPAVDERGLLLLGVLLAGAGAVALRKSNLV